MKTIQLFGRDESGKPVLVTVTREEIDAARRMMIASSGKPHVSGSCLRCDREVPVPGKSYCPTCEE